jgi:sugar/nucleoside kinase (ribokinase family)
MLNQTAGLEAVDRDCIRRAIQAQGLGDACHAADLIVLANWSRYPNMTECWRVLRDQAISGAERRPWIVIDLADPAGRSEDDIREMLEVISSLPQYARVALSLNRNEAAVVGGSLGFRVEQGTPNDALSILDRLGIDLAIIHARDRSVAASTKGTADFQTRFTPSPARTIGAGDRFGAGVGAALIAGIEPALAVYIGNVAAGFFVRTTRAPKMDELVAFAKNWDREVAANP